MTSPASGLKAIIAAIDPTITNGWKLALGKMLANPDKVITFLDTGGKPAEVRQNIDYPTVQIMIRGDNSATGYEDAFAVGLRVRDALVAIPSAPVHYTELTSCVQRGGLMNIGYDDSDRPQLSLNLQLITTPEPEVSGYRETI